MREHELAPNGRAVDEDEGAVQPLAMAPAQIAVGVQSGEDGTVQIICLPATFTADDAERFAQVILGAVARARLLLSRRERTEGIERAVCRECGAEIYRARSEAGSFGVWMHVDLDAASRKRKHEARP